MRIRNPWLVLAMLLAIAGCDAGGDGVGPAGPLHDVQPVAPPDGTLGETQIHSEPAPEDTTARWGGSLGSGT